MQASITVSGDPSLQYLLRIGDLCLIHGQRTAEWCGHAPVLEEDIALSNMALDLIGQARAVLSLAGSLNQPILDEDQLAFLRDERDYRNVTLVELPRGDFAFTVLRNLMVATFCRLLWQRLAGHSSNGDLAGIAAKAVKESRYHQQHAADWLVRLGDGTEESAGRCAAAMSRLWPYGAEWFDGDAIDDAAAASGIGPRWSELRAPWLAAMTAVCAEAKVPVPVTGAFRSTGKRGVHSEHMGFLLAEMQHLQRSFPGGVW
ncbi:MAG: 1,2-phenylacetyl-CoA epoxidase subunit PaaC [Rubrivivax sp.]